MKSKSKLLFIVLLVFSAVGLSQAAADRNGGEISYNSVDFSHDSHSDFSCDSCHKGIFEKKAGSILTDPNFSMDAIYEGLYCGACHNGDNAFDAVDDCSACHVRGGGDILYTEPVKSVLFSHDVHEGIDCESCHDDVFEMKALAAQEADDFNMEALYQGKYCGFCHDGATAFASDTRCASCHLGVKGYNRLNSSAAPAEHSSH